MLSRKKPLARMTRILIQISAAALLLLVGCPCYGWAALPKQEKESRWTAQTDREVVQRLGSRDPDESYEAARQIFRRGERMIPLLVDLKGDRRPFARGFLGHSSSGDFAFLPEGDDWEEGRIVTVEVAALYLISAIYFEDFHFGFSGYLKDVTGRQSECITDSKGEWPRSNSRERVERAWSSLESWMAQYSKEGLASLRGHKHHPLAGSGLGF